jgi:prolyl oligopeptidase
MRLSSMALIISTLMASASMTHAQAPAPASAGTEDPYLWLEDVTGDKALSWVKEQNADSKKSLEAQTSFSGLRDDIRSILDSNVRIPYVGKQGNYYYNFWRDKTNPAGIWRRTTLEEYRKTEPKWEVLIDLDALNKAEKENWVWHGSDCLRPAYTQCLVALSRGGADADVTREFNLDTKQWVKDGFFRPEAKGGLGWIDENTVFVSTDFGAGSMTESGYARIAKVWKRGTPMSEATMAYEGKNTDLGVGAYQDHTPGFKRQFVIRNIAFYNDELYLRNADGSNTKIDVPNSAAKSVYREWMSLELREPYTAGGKTYPAGALIVTKFDDFMKGGRNFDVIFEPSETTSFAGFSPTKNYFILNVLDNVKNRLYVLKHDGKTWTREPLQGAPSFGTVSASGIDADESDDYFLTVTDYVTPTTLMMGSIGKNPEPLKQLPAFFDAKNLKIDQFFATSKDGTKVPYFMVSSKGIKRDGKNPTLLYGYGGFEVSLTPNYSAVAGRAWLTQGGVYVVANIRGGGEYGPRWHQAALKENRHRAYEDFAAVAEDLIAKKVTSPKHLGIQGGSNGGLLMGNMTVMYPKLFGAVVCQVPLLDMKRYNKLLAGASWMAEYGNPDTDDWKFIQTFSPYQNVKKDEKYPPVLFTTSTRDDRVHPGHARKMMALMKAQGHDVIYYENIEGGHGGAANNEQAAYMQALAYTFLKKKLFAQ